MASFGTTQPASWLDAGSGFGSAFGVLSPATQGSATVPFQSFSAGSLGKNTTSQPFTQPSTMDSISNMLNVYSQRKWGAKYGGSYGGSTAGGGTGGMTSLGGDWANVDQWNNSISTATNSFGVPGNLIKSIMKLESGGNNLAPNGATALGPMQVTTSNWGADAARMGLDLSNPNDNIQMGAYILKQNYDQFKGWADANGVDPWKAAVYAYYAGNPYDLTAHDDPSQGGSGMSTGAYGDQIWQQYQNLNQMGGTGAGLSSGGSGGSILSTAFGTNTVPDWGEYNQPSDLGYYSYGSQYGLSGRTHTGVDVPLPVGSNMNAAFKGTVMCAGTGIGSGSDGGGCAAFGYEPGTFGGPPAMSGSGRIEILSDDGNTILIYGHAEGSAVRPGQQVNVGDLLGYSGGMNSGHVHVEARVRDSSTPSGWRIVDPRTILGGGVPGMGPTGGGYNPYAGMSMAQMAMAGNIQGGGAPLPNTGYDAVGSRWGSTIRDAMAGR